MEQPPKSSCEHCGKVFIKEKKGYNRRGCHLLFPGQEGFYCLECFALLKKISDAPKRVRSVTESGSPFTPTKSPGRKKRCVSSPLKKSTPLQKVKTPVKCSLSSPLARLTKNASLSRYKPVLRTLMQVKGFRTTLQKDRIGLIHNEINSFCRQKDSKFHQPMSLQSLSTFIWESCLTELEKTAPATVTILRTLLCKRGEEYKALPGGSLFSTLGVLLGIILNAREPNKVRLVQNLVSLQMYRCGCPQKLLTAFNRLHISVGVKGTRALVDRVVEEYKARFQEKKQLMEEYLRKHHGSKSKAVRRLAFVDESAPVSETAGESQGYPFCWDNAQISGQSRYQTSEKNVWMRLWALCYAASNRVRTETLSDDPPTQTAMAIPISEFLPSENHEADLRKWLELHVKQSLAEHLPAFQSFRKEIMKENLKHAHWDEMKEKSVVMNLGVLDENPSSTDGAIGIMELLSTLVPICPDGKPYTIITHCDGGAFERMVSARKVRAPDHGPLRQLLWVEPSAQEFHKRGLMLQIIMDKFFSGKSQGDRGTLSNIKTVMGQHSVKTKVMESFNHVESMFEMTCDGLICLLAMQFLGVTEQDQHLPVLQFCEDEEERERILEETAYSIVETIWQHPSREAIAQVSNAVVLPETLPDEICCGQDMPGKLVLCSNGNCPSGGIFHEECIALVTSIRPDPKEDWWCSPNCQGWSRFCVCKRHKDDSLMVACAKGKDCENGMWFHLPCVGLNHAPEEDEDWFCPACQPPPKGADSIFNYSISLLWMLLNDRIRKTAIRNGDGHMMLQFWKDDGIHFWNDKHNKYLILMHRLTAGVNGWLSERQAADLTWNRTVNIHGGVGKNVSMDRVNEFLNNDSKENLKHVRGQYTESAVRRSSYIAGGVTRDLDAAFSSNIAQSAEKKFKARRFTPRHDSVRKFVVEYQGDDLFSQVTGREHRNFPHFDAKLSAIRKPSDI